MGDGRSERSALHVADLDRTAFAVGGTIGLRLREKTAHKETASLLLLTRRKARALSPSLRASGAKRGTAFRALTGPDRKGRALVLDQGLTPTTNRGNSPNW